MSLGYASKLSYREDLGGELGAPEYQEKPTELSRKVTQLIDLIRGSEKIVVFTGAGISTSCGIPDFRGPNGIWTLQRRGRKLPPLQKSFEFAIPGLTHQALKALVECGIVDFVVSQNVDGLHRRSDLQVEKLAELHGNCFSEKCSSCKAEYIRDFEMATVGFQRTGRSCSKDGCIGRLRDNVLDWEDPLPEQQLKLSQQLSSSADLALCLGTSLQITPACNIPLLTVKSGGKLVIVNKQKTPKDKEAEMVIHHSVDQVMGEVMKGLEVEVPKYVREDRIVVLHHQAAPKTRELKTGDIRQRYRACLTSISIHTQNKARSSLDCSEVMRWSVTRLRTGRVQAFLDLEFHQDLGKPSEQVVYSFDVLGKKAYQTYLKTGSLENHVALQDMPNRSLPIMKWQEYTFVTQEQEYSA